MIIWLASYPRSGNTYFRVLLNHYYGFKSYSMYDEKSQFSMFSFNNDAAIDLSKMRESKKIFFVKSHDFPLDDEPAIYLVRDGRDALLSYAHYILSFEKEKEGGVNFEAEVTQTLHDLIVYNASFGGWSSNVLAWVRRSAPTIFVRFEDLIQSNKPVSMLEKAFKLLKLPIKTKKKNSPPPTFSALKKKTPDFFREGRIGSWEASMSDELHELFWQYHYSAMDLMGYAKHNTTTLQLNEVRSPFSTTALAYKRHVELLGREQILRDAELNLRERELDLQFKEQRYKSNEREFQRVVQKNRKIKKKLRELKTEISSIRPSLQEKEDVIQAFRNSPRYWLLNGPVRVIPGLRNLLEFAFSMRDRFAPKLGIYYQYPPRNLVLPKKYYNEESISEKHLPLISIVTPSYNQAVFLERTIKSVLSQNYLNLEYVVQDGRSTDHSSEILEQYQQYFHYFESIPDRGQAHAINLGFRNTSGEIMAYLNSDDLLLPGTLHYVAKYFIEHPEVDVLYGHRVIVDENDQEVGVWILPPHDSEVLRWADFIPQETLFWRRALWEKCGGKLDETFHFALDWDLLIRFQQAGGKFVRLPRFLGAFRVHQRQKSTSQIHDLGVKEMNILRQRIHGREVLQNEIDLKVRRYLMRSVLLHKLYRLGLLLY